MSNCSPTARPKNDGGEEVPLDPQAPFVAEDGYEYVDFAAFLLGEPAQTTRNSNVHAYREAGNHPIAIQAYIEAFDEGKARLLGYGVEFGYRHSRAIEAARGTNGFAPPHIWESAINSEFAGAI